MQKGILNHLEYLSWDARRCLVSTGDISKEVYEEYSRRRYQEFRKM
jgi:hypothetical protein